MARRASKVYRAPVRSLAPQGPVPKRVRLLWENKMLDSPIIENRQGHVIFGGKLGAGPKQL